CESTIKVENYSSTAEAVVILIGTDNTRGDEYKYNKYDLGINGYVVKQVGTKIIVQGGSSNSLATAITYLKEKVFGLRKTNDPFDYFTMADSTNKEYIQSGYTVSQITIAGNSIKSYVITYPKANRNAKTAAETLRDTLYRECGIYITTDTSPDDGARTVSINVLTNSGVGNGYSVYVDDNGDLKIDCEFEYLLTELCAEFTETCILSGSGTVAFQKGTVTTKDIRNITYEQYGAIGDGDANDFAALKATHDIANQHGHTVHAKRDGTATYYIGDTNAETITVMTDTYWHGCTFVFDDSIINVHPSTTCPNGGYAGCDDCKMRTKPIFTVASGISSQDVTAKLAYVTEANPLNGGYGEADNTTKLEGWDLPYLALIKITSDYHKIYVRGGNKENAANADSGDLQCEFILVKPDGTIDPSTPLSWDYPSISSAIAENVDPTYVKAITIDGGGATINTISNAPDDTVQNTYISFDRNIKVTRANTILKNFNHRLLNERTYRAPYNGIISVNHVNNVTFRDITIQAASRKYQDGAMQGTYEIGGLGGNDIKYYNVDTVNLFTDGNDDPSDGTTAPAGFLHIGGCMGTNYCRNFLFEDCTLNTFDSHKGLGNVTLRNCEVGSATMQGSGDILIENHTAYVSNSASVVLLRSDYGSTWRGKLTMKNIDIKYDANDPYTEGNAATRITLFNTNRYEQNGVYESFLNKNTGEYVIPETFTNYLPTTVDIENVTLYVYNYTGFDSATGKHIGYTEQLADDDVYLFNMSIYTYSEDLRYAFANRYLAPDSISIKGSSANIILPDTPQFDDCEITVTDSENVKYYS
ncbi:MAG: hypothetical protein J6Q69_07225, partial [Clostridia bacterium]|nr:hypothetical protein [Clostridia bacterium]